MNPFQKNRMSKNIDTSQLIVQELGNPYQRVTIVFLLIGVIPALTILYILSGKFDPSDRQIIDVAALLFFANLIMVLGFIIGYGLIKKIIQKIISYAEKSKKADELKSSFAMSLAHDMKHPFAVIKAHISNLKAGFMGPLSAEQADTLKICKEVIDRTDTLLMDLVNTYKIEARLTELKIEVFDLRKLLEEQRREFETIAASKPVTLVFEPVHTPLPFKGDRGMIVRAVNNLLGNALKYTPAGGTITAKAYTMSGLARIEITNTGKKIPEDKLEKIFNKFERLDGQIEGEGLGLAIAKDIVELHKGRIWASSGPGDFNCFTLLLPLTGEKIP